MGKPHKGPGSFETGVFGNTLTLPMNAVAYLNPNQEVLGCPRKFVNG